MDVSVLLFTSGTTGLPKGTAHFMEESLIVADGFGKYCWGVTDKDVIGGPAPLAMAAGYSTVGVIPFRFGAGVSLIARFDPVSMFKNIRDHKISILSALPTAYRKMIADIDPKEWDYSSLRFCTGGGEALTAKTYLDWKEKFGLEIYEGLGTTEMMFVFISSAVTKKVKPGAIGTACPGYEVRVVNENFEQVKPGDVGKMIVRGPTGTIYWKDNEKQKSCVRDGWCLAGDVVTMDEDGYVQFLSREDDLIKSSGYRIGPEEIEEALVTHPAVLDAGVVGVPDPIMGQKTKAFVQLKPGVAASDELKKELLEHCKKKIAVYKLPRDIDFIEAMPRTAVGKLLRRILRQQEIEKARGLTEAAPRYPGADRAIAASSRARNRSTRLFSASGGRSLPSILKTSAPARIHEGSSSSSERGSRGTGSPRQTRRHPPPRFADAVPPSGPSAAYPVRPHLPGEGTRRGTRRRPRSASPKRA